MKSNSRACRKDGTLKNADEMEWPNSTSKGVGVSMPKCPLEGGSRSGDDAIAKKKAQVSSITKDKVD